LGATLLVLAFAPLFRLMDPSVEEPFREASIEIAEVTLELAWWGTLATLLLAWILARLFPAHGLRGAVAKMIHWLGAPPIWTYATALGALTTGLAALVSILLYEGFFTNVDEIAYTVQARYLARGLLAGPTFSAPEFWVIPNTLVVPKGWVAQYPPTHTVAMAAAHALGHPGILGPISLGILVAFVTLSLGLLVPERPGAARAAALAVALCPLLLFLGGGAMSHLTTGALVAAALYFSLRGRDGPAWWSAPVGVTLGLAVADRPLTGLVLGTVFTVGVWLPAALGEGKGTRWLLDRIWGTVAGGAPIAVLLGAYNKALFGDVRALGYLAAYGDRHRLGFHMDPWGYPYGISEALGFTSTDVLSAGVQLLETPVPITALIGLYLLTGRPLPRGGGLLLAWAFLPVLVNGAYWFHSVRMLAEAAPAWVALGVLAVAELIRGADPAHGADADGGTTRPPWGARVSGAYLPDVVTWGTAVSVLAAVLLGVPGRWASYAWTQETLGRITAPEPSPGTAAVVFVHVSWNERMSATLQGAGHMRQDSVVTILRRNTNCSLHLYSLAREAQARSGGAAPLPTIDLEQAPGTPPELQRLASSPGTTVRTRRGEAFPQTCARELRADRFGAVALAPLLWQGDLPGIEGDRPLFVRDLGPERNQRILDLYPRRTAYAFTPTAPEGPPRLLPYRDAMELLWGPSSRLDR